MIDIDIPFVVITTAKNEELYIRNLIKSVINQKILPMNWVIVNDGSTDNTDKIVREYQKKYNFIKLLSLKNNGTRSFGSKAKAFKAGIETIKEKKYEFIGNLDADVSFNSDYFYNILLEMFKDEKLGVAGGTILEKKNGVYKERQGNRNRSVPGAIQMFRRKCFEEIGGYLEIKEGGIDTAAIIFAKYLGWRTKSFFEHEVFHHRPSTKKGMPILYTRYREGTVDYILGYHPLYFLAKCIRRIIEKPYIFGSLVRIYGYFKMFFKKAKRPLSKKVIKHQRNEQIKRLKNKLFPRSRIR